MGQPKKPEEKIDLKGKWIRKDKKYAFFLIVGLILGYINYNYGPIIIGNDIRYTIIIILLPIAIGISLHAIFGKRFLVLGTKAANDPLWHKVIYYLFIFLIAIVYSYATLGTAASVSWSTVNYYTSRKSERKEITVPVDTFSRGTAKNPSHKIYFYFNNEREKIKVNQATIKQLQAEAATKNKIKLYLRESVWNHYLVEDWDIIE